MGHVERHLQKTDEELIIRLLKDWKLFSFLKTKKAPIDGCQAVD